MFIMRLAQDVLQRCELNELTNFSSLRLIKSQKETVSILKHRGVLKHERNVLSHYRRKISRYRATARSPRIYMTCRQNCWDVMSGVRSRALSASDCETEEWAFRFIKGNRAAIASKVSWKTSGISYENVSSRNRRRPSILEESFREFWTDSGSKYGTTNL